MCPLDTTPDKLGPFEGRVKIWQSRRGAERSLPARRDFPVEDFVDWMGRIFIARIERTRSTFVLPSGTPPWRSGGTSITPTRPWARRRSRRISGARNWHFSDQWRPYRVSASLRGVSPIISAGSKKSSALIRRWQRRERTPKSSPRLSKFEPIQPSMICSPTVRSLLTRR